MDYLQAEEEGIVKNIGMLFSSFDVSYQFGHTPVHPSIKFVESLLTHLDFHKELVEIVNDIPSGRIMILVNR